MKFTKKWRLLVFEFILYVLIISNAITPILCMDPDQASKGILNADLPMPGADIPIILTSTSPTKSTKAYSQVCNSFDMKKQITFVTITLYLLISNFSIIYKHQKKTLQRGNINVSIAQRILKHLKD